METVLPFFFESRTARRIISSVTRRMTSSGVGGVDRDMDSVCEEGIQVIEYSEKNFQEAI
jgi:hypothetical protein